MLDRTGSEHFTDDSPLEAMAVITPSDDEVRAALKRIVTSSEFLSSPHLAAFLSFSVETTLAGEGQNIKAYSVATSVLGRPPTFDPQADPIVRVEATRLRRAMERYYLHDGADDPILIDIPRGRYIAFFSYRNCKGVALDATLPAQSDDGFISHDLISAASESLSLTQRFHTMWSNFSRSERNSVAVFALGLMAAFVTWGVVPLWDRSQKPVEQALMLQPAAAVHADNVDSFTTGTINPTEAPLQRVNFASLQINPFVSYTNDPEHRDLSHRLAHMIAERAPEFEGIPVFDPDATLPADPANDQYYALSGTILQDSSHPERVEISVRLIQRPSSEIIWAKSYQTDSGLSLFDDRLFAIRDDIIHAIAGLNGAIRVDDARRHIDNRANSGPFQVCLAESDLALRTEAPSEIKKAIACLSALIQKKPGEALLYKQLAALRMTLSHDELAQAPDLRMKALSLAMTDLETAIRLQPVDPAAHSALRKLQDTRIRMP